ncbi:threonine dehydratase [Streptomyces clavuligerus]|nr:threonine dehydratase [Streptomyces clavuligerus]
MPTTMTTITTTTTGATRVHQLSQDDITAAAERVSGRVRPVLLTPWEEFAEPDRGDDGGIWLALEFLQHTGSFKDRGALNFLRAHQEAGALPEAGVTIASGGNAGLACAWAAREQGVRATVFVPVGAPEVKVRRLRGLGAEVRQVGTEYAEALAACEEYAASSGALASHAYDHPLVASGAFCCWRISTVCSSDFYPVGRLSFCPSCS